MSTRPGQNDKLIPKQPARYGKIHATNFISTHNYQLLAHLVEDDDAHDLALDDDDAALVVDADAARVLQDVGAELAHELAVLVVYLHLRKEHDWEAQC